VKMTDLYTRTKALLGSYNMSKLKDARVLVVGLGGVGGYIVEALARAGVGTIGLCDFDTVDPSNLNRQILATTDTIGLLKTDVAKDRVFRINPDCRVKLYSFRLTPSNIKDLDIIVDCPEGYKLCANCGKCLKSWDFIADAIDDVPSKLALAEKTHKMGIPFISSMGTGNKMDPFGFTIAPIDKTEGDPLARAVRKRLRELEITDTPVLYSKEPARVEIMQGDSIPSISFMPAVAGLEIASYIIKKIIEKED